MTSLSSAETLAFSRMRGSCARLGFADAIERGGDPPLGGDDVRDGARACRAALPTGTGSGNAGKAVPPAVPWRIAAQQRFEGTHGLLVGEAGLPDGILERSKVRSGQRDVLLTARAHFLPVFGEAQQLT